MPLLGHLLPILPTLPVENSVLVSLQTAARMLKVGKTHWVAAMDIKDLSVPRKELSRFGPAWHAVKQVQDGMDVGLGTGTTAYWFTVLLGHRIKNEGLRVRGVPTSTQTAEIAQFHDVPLITLNDVKRLDLVVDGADEISAKLELIKGGGAALLREKIVANTASKMIIIADEMKYVDKLGKFPLPVEIVKFGWRTTVEKISELLGDSDVANNRCEIRAAGMGPVITDEGHYIVDCYCETINCPNNLASELNDIPGVVENGLFVNYADEVILGNAKGRVRTISLLRGDLGDLHPDLPIDLEITGEK